MSGPLFALVFGALLLVIATFLAMRPHGSRPAHASEAPPAGWRGFGYVTRKLFDRGGDEFHYSFSMPAGLALSFVVGFLSSILGIGGGIVHVPALVVLFHFPAHIAAATSHFILAISAAVGTASHLSLGNVDLGVGLAIGGGCVVGAQLGGALSTRVKGVTIVRALAVALGLVGLRLLWQAVA
jgi:uncharacterized membrane protein YfcA